MDTSNRSGIENELDRIMKKIQEIVEKSVDGDYIFRGEAECYPKVSSGLYRQYSGDFGVEDDSIEIIQEVIIVRMAKRYLDQTDELEILTELQHYGGKTNLIDFTTDYLIALFFACEGSRDRDGRIILLKKESEDYEVKNPPNTVNRAGSQKSLFVQAPKGFIEPDSEITIPKNLKQPILNYLQKHHDISAKHIYNDIHGFIKWLGIHIDSHLEAAKGTIFQHRGDVENNRKEKFKLYKKAIVYYTEALRLNPSLFDVYDKRGIIYNSEGDHDRAIQNYNKAIELYPDYAEAYANRGLAYSEKGEPDKAIQDYDKAIELKPEIARVYSNRGVTYVEKGDFERAFSDFNTAIELDPANAKTYSNRGNFYFFRGDFERALTDFDKVIKLRPDYFKAYCIRGKTWLHLKEWEKAKEDLTLARDRGIDVIASFHNDYESIENFEKENNIQLPENIKAMLTQR